MIILLEDVKFIPFHDTRRPAPDRRRPHRNQRRHISDLAASFTPLTADDLRNLGAYEIALRPCVGGRTLMPVTGTTYPLPEATTDGAALARDSRRRYGHCAADIDTQITGRTRAAAPLPARIGRTTDTDDPIAADESRSDGETS